MLHEQGKMDVSLSLICSVLDATAKKVIPSKNNNQRNKEFIRKYMPIITTYGFPGLYAGAIMIKCIDIPNLKTDKDGFVGIEDIIYHTIRCGLIHECEIESLIEFTDETEIGDFIGKFKIPKQLFWGLAMATILCKENKNLKLDSDMQISISGFDFTVNELFGKQDELDKLVKEKADTNV